MKEYIEFLKIFTILDNFEIFLYTTTLSAHQCSIVLDIKKGVQKQIFFLQLGRGILPFQRMVCSTWYYLTTVAKDLLSVT